MTQPERELYLSGISCWALCAIAFAWAGFPGWLPAQDVGRIERFVEGMDQEPKPMTAADISTELNDLFRKLALSGSALPAGLEDILATIDRANGTPDGLVAQASYVVGESGQIPVTALPRDRRAVRLVVTRGREEDEPPILISAPAGERLGVLEVMSWDAQKSAFNFYRRLRPNIWQWKGDSGHALADASRHKACFRCHVNGAPVMKELELPWNNWSTMNARIQPENVPETIANSRLFQQHVNADQLELRVVQPWISRSMKRRVARTIDVSHHKLRGARQLMQHLFSNTTVNLRTSPQQARSAETPLQLPLELFINRQGLADVIPDVALPSVPRDVYRRIVSEKYRFRLQDGAFEFPGDTHFAFLVPVPAQEDLEAIREMVSQRVIPEKFVLCVLLTDFTNPVYSAERERLWQQYVPDEAEFQSGASDLAERVTAAMAAAVCRDSLPASSSEARFLAMWRFSQEDLQADAERRVRQYLEAAAQRANTLEGFDAYVQLAESRRRRFANSPLNEFPLLLPRNDLVFQLEMRADGTVAERRHVLRSDPP